MKHTFITATSIQDGKELPVITALTYPYMNCQVIPTTPDVFDAVLSRLTERGWVAYVPDRKDFLVIHIGGGKEISITQQNVERVALDMQECLREAAIYWANNNPIK